MQIEEYNSDDFLIVGDSFCSNRTKKYSWPQEVLTHLTNKKFNSKIVPRGKGFSGGAWWSYRKVLLKELEIKVPKVLIICHTEPNRLPNDLDYGINFKSVETKLIDIDNKEYKMPDKIASAAVSYYKELFSFDFNEWAVRQWFKEVDELCETYKIEKVIHLYCFDGKYTDYTFKHGVTISVPLWSYAEEPKIYFWNLKSITVNHYTPKGNKLFAETIIDLIKNYPGDNVRLDIKLVNYEPS